VPLEELRRLFPQLIRAALPDVTAEQLSAAQRVYDEQLAAVAGPGSTDAGFTIDQATEALALALDRLG
jgi:hypothetical protein